MALLTVFLASAGLAQADERMSAQEFTQSFAARVEKLFPDARVTIKQALEVEIKRGAEYEALLFKGNLDNAFKKYLDEPWRLEDILNEHARVSASAPDKASFAKREQLVAVIRHQSYLDEINKTKRADQEFPMHRLAGDIAVYYAFDAPDTIRYADSRMIEETGLTRSDFESVAIENLRRIMVEPLLETYPEMVVISANDPYMTSVLLFDQFWNPDRFRFRGDLVVFVLTRDLMLVTGSEESAGLAATQKAARDLIEKLPYAISSEPIVRRQGKWEAFQP
ncbi:DUF1444 family protein [Taklimakanibacter lacteus]|uniref:DUF1444 family protein n=1 Tax=Taklimakanibacter lacteus TaxID=2268456 RepID=UPI0013C3FCD1